MTQPSIQDEGYLNKLQKKETFPLHLHWDGSVPATHLYALAQEKGVELLLPERDIHHKPIVYKNKEARRIKNPEQLTLFMQNLRDYDLVDVFDMTVRFMQTEEDLKSLALGHCEYLKSQNSPYAETRFAPQYHTQKGLTMEQVVEYAVQGFKDGKEQTGVDARLILCIGREAEPKVGVEVAQLAVEMNKRYPDMILGLDLACEETAHPPEKHKKAFELTFDTSLKRTVHAGEMCDEKTNLKNIRTAVYDLRADGLGHAIPLYKDKELMQEIVKRNIRVESNPLSNCAFFINDPRELHLDELVKNNVLVTVNPDDPSMLPNGDTVHNLYHIGKMYGDQLATKMIANSIQAAWGLQPEEKRKFVNTLLFGN